MQKWGDILSERALAHFAGREREVDTLVGLFEKGGPLVVHVHGVAGIGKSSLLEAFARRTRAQGIRLVRIDCRNVEPTARGLLTELSDALGESLSSVEDVAQRVASFGEAVAIVLDTYEMFVLLDTWIRQVFVPSLPVNARVAIGSRNPPSPAWRTAPGWQGLFRSLPLDPLPETDALRYLASSGIPADVARRINGLVRGHPLALSMSASIALSDAGRSIQDTGLHQVIDELSRSYIEAVPDAITRRALEASSVVRCVTEPLLHALLPEIAPRDAMERLGALPFVEFGREGLFIHEAVRSAIDSSLAARDPDTRREYRRAAWAYLQSRQRANGPGTWRDTADLLFLLENPVLREGFFPSGAQPLAVEPATAGDEEAVLRLVAAKAAPERQALAAWWHYHSDSFRVVRDRDGSICGFSIFLHASELNEAVVAADPVAAVWQRDAAARGASSALFCRRWLDRDVGESPSASQAASWVDCKRTYMEMRGTLRWVYAAVANPEPYLAAVTKLGFRPLSEPTADVGGLALHSVLLDMGPGSVDAWLADLVGAEITAEDIRASMLDVDGRELVLTSGRVNLTSLEFGVMQYLQDHPGKAVSRYDLMEAVWGYRNDTASNVVDVVVRSLRRKLGVESSVVETVRGTGYRYRMPASAP